MIKNIIKKLNNIKINKNNQFKDKDYKTLIIIMIYKNLLQNLKFLELLLGLQKNDDHIIYLQIKSFSFLFKSFLIILFGYFS